MSTSRCMGVWLLARAGCLQSSSSGGGQLIPISKLLLELVLPVCPALLSHPGMSQEQS